MIGIYKITSPTKKVYIGQSLDIEKRWKFYKRLNCKTQVKLYNSLLKYGVDKHKFEIIQLCNESELNELEKYYVDLFQTFNNKHGLNLRDGGGNKGKTAEETKEKQRASSIGKVMSKEARLKMSISKKGKKPSAESITKTTLKNTGKKRSLETKQKMSNWVRTTEMKKKMSESALGKKFSIESRKKMSYSRTKLILNLETGIYYFGIQDLIKSYNKLSVGMLYHRLNGHKINNTQFIYV